MTLPLSFARPRRLCRPALPLIAAVLPLMLAAAPDEVVRLPEVVINEQAAPPPPEAWQQARIDGFEVLTNAAEGRARRLLQDFQVFRQALSVAWPMPARPVAHSALILCGDRRSFDALTDRAPTDSGSGRVSAFLQGREGRAIVLDLGSTVLNVGESETDAAGRFTEVRAEAARQLYREYVFFLLRQGEARAPAWLEEGVAQIVTAMEFTDRTLTVGRVYDAAGPTSTGEPVTATAGEEDPEAFAAEGTEDGGFNAALSRRALLPLGDFFAVKAGSAAARHPLGNNRWAKQAYAFVHLCLYGERGRFRKPLALWLQKLATQPPSEAAFRECFGMGYAAMQAELRGYLEMTAYTYQQFNLDKDSRFAAEPVEFRAATESEIGRMKGDVQGLAGRPEDALASYRASYQRGGREPGLLAALGVAEAGAGRVDRARPLLEAAVKAGVGRPAAYAALARLRLEEARKRGPLDAASAGEVLAVLSAGSKIPPALPETFRVLADLWVATAEPASPAQLDGLDRGVRLFPRDPVLALAAARANRRAGNHERATALVRLGLRSAEGEEVRAELRQLLGELAEPKTP